MPVSSVMLRDGHAFGLRVSDPWVVEDIQALLANAQAYRDKVPFPVHTIVYASEMIDVPTGALRLRDMPAFRHPRRGHMVVVAARAYIQVMMETLARLSYLETLKFFNTEDEMWEYLDPVIANDNALISQSSPASTPPTVAATVTPSDQPATGLVISSAPPPGMDDNIPDDKRKTQPAATVNPASTAESTTPDTTTL